MQIDICNLDNTVELEKQTSMLVDLHLQNIFLYPGFLKAVQETYNIKGLYITCFTDNKLVGVGAFYEKRNLIGKKTLVSVPGGGWTMNRNVEKGMISLLDSYIKEEDLKGPFFCDLQRPLLTLNSQHIYSRTVKNLPVDETSLISSFSKNIRRDYKAAVKMGLKIKESDDIEAFYKVWAGNMRDLGTPPVPASFFINLRNNFRENINILLVQKNLVTVGGAFIIQMGNYAIDLYASSLRSYFKLFPNIFLYYEMLSWACRREIKLFDMGRSQPGSGNEKFKLRFGTELLPLYSYPYQTVCQNQKIMKSIFAQAWKHVPVAVSNRAGPFIRGYIPFG